VFVEDGKAMLVDEEIRDVLLSRPRRNVRFDTLM